MLCKTGCGELVSDGSDSKLCSKCRSSLYYWSQYNTERAKERMEKLEFWQNRLRLFAEGGYLGAKKKRNRRK